MISTQNHLPSATPAFLTDVRDGLRRTPRRLPAKYFYDARGDALFQQIMHCPAYYLYRAEQGILSGQGKTITRRLGALADRYQVVELGPGDASKSRLLLTDMSEAGLVHSYLAIDISAHVIETVPRLLSSTLPGITVTGLAGDYLAALAGHPRPAGVRRLILFLGASIGNFTPEEALSFSKRLNLLSEPGDCVLTGFDLKKHPGVILRAYDDAGGLTRAFNLNLLVRINREAEGDFATERFDHYPSYDPETGCCKSFLVSLEDQAVRIAGERFDFREGETILTEISQKYAPAAIGELAVAAGFRSVADYSDRKGWFTDALWQLPG